MIQATGTAVVGAVTVLSGVVGIIGVSVSDAYNYIFVGRDAPPAPTATSLVDPAAPSALAPSASQLANLPTTFSVQAKVAHAAPPASTVAEKERDGSTPQRLEPSAPVVQTMLSPGMMRPPALDRNKAPEQVPAPPAASALKNRRTVALRESGAEIICGSRFRVEFYSASAERIALRWSDGSSGPVKLTAGKAQELSPGCSVTLVRVLPGAPQIAEVTETTIR